MRSGEIKAPKTLDDLNIRPDLLASLLLRSLALADQLSGSALEERLGVPFEALQPIIQEFKKQQLLDTAGFSNEPGLQGRPLDLVMNYVISSAGRQRAAELALVQSRYLGVCPISFEDYVELVHSQMEERTAVTEEMLKRALANLELDHSVIDQIGAAMVSRSSLFIFGAPGNGKSTITERIAFLMGEPIEVPYAVALDDEIVRVLDPVHHRLVEGEQPADRRLVRVYRPVVTAGGELKMNQLDLSYDATNRYYEAPLQWKANCGVLVIDDFGRQEEPPKRLLNRFIVPMEKKVDYMDLSGSGRKVEVPFLCQVVFSTNLQPSELVDEAFLRRMAYKIGVGDPTPEAYTRIMRYECELNGVPFDERAVHYLLQLYGTRPLRGSHPRQLVARLVDLAHYRGEQPLLTPPSLREAFNACFNPALGRSVEEDWANAVNGSGNHHLDVGRPVATKS